MPGSQSQSPRPLATIVARLDAVLDTAGTPDYPGALNGLQLANGGQVRGLAAAVDFSRAAIDGAAASGANLLIVHHGMFWGGVQAIRGTAYERIRDLIKGDIAVYASHLPLDRHPAIGNNVLLARALDLVPSGDFARYKTVSIGVRGEANIETAELIARARRFARSRGGEVRVAALPDRHRTRRWGICTGAGASNESLREAADLGLDTLIVGEGPHHTAVEAAELGIAVIYAGHYATETTGVRALTEQIATEFALPWSFVGTPTGL